MGESRVNAFTWGSWKREFIFVKFKKKITEQRTTFKCSKRRQKLLKFNSHLHETMYLIKKLKAANSFLALALDIYQCFIVTYE